MKIRNTFLYLVFSLLSFFVCADITNAMSCVRLDTFGDYYYQCGVFKITKTATVILGDEIKNFTFSDTEASWDFFDGVFGVTTSNRLVFSSGGTKTNPYQIYSWADLNGVRNNLSKSFILMTNLDTASPGYSTYASASANGGAGWTPIKPFSGTFDGNGYTISGLYLSGRNESNRGLFGGLEPGAEISNLGVINATVVQGGTNSDQNIAILVGENKGGKISKSYTTGSVSVNPNCSNIGGLVGKNVGKTSAATISDSYTTADVSGGSQTGGLVGNHYKDNVTPSIINSYAVSNVSGRWNIGNLVGYNSQNSGSISNSFYNNQKGLSCGDPCNKQYYGTGITDAQMKSFSTFSNAGWNIAQTTNYTNQTWRIHDFYNYPTLRYNSIVATVPILNKFLVQRKVSGGVSVFWDSINTTACSQSLSAGTAVSGEILEANFSGGQYSISCVGSGGIIYATTTFPVSLEQLYLIKKVGSTPSPDGGIVTVTDSFTTHTCGEGCYYPSWYLSKGDTITLKATPAPGYNFSNWYSYMSACSGSLDTCTFVLDAYKSVNATFNPIVLLQPTVSINSSAPVTNVGDRTLLTWSSNNANSCYAVGGWGKGIDTLPVSGSTTTSPVILGMNYFPISCTGSGGTAYATSTVEGKDYLSESPCPSGKWWFDEGSYYVEGHYVTPGLNECFCGDDTYSCYCGNEDIDCSPDTYDCE